MKEKRNSHGVAILLNSNFEYNIMSSDKDITGYRSDHSILKISFLLNNFSLGKGIWKFNNSLLGLPNYISLINKVTEKELIKYSVPVYTLDYIKNGTKDVTLTFGHDLFLELLFLRIRGETIKFASYEKQKK